MALTPSQRQVRDAFNTALANGSIATENVACLCGSHSLDVVAEEDRYGIRLPTSICRECGLIQSNPRLTATAYEEFYSGGTYRILYDGSTYVENYDAAFVSSRGARIRAAVEAALGRPIDTSDRVLEIGAGGGWNLVAFRDAGAKVIGYDYSPDLVALGRAHGIPMEQGSTSEIVSARGSYNIIVLSHVLEHFLDPVAELRRIREVVEPGGRLYVGVPATDYPFQGLLQNAHTYYFTDATLRHYLGRAGWRAGKIVHEDPFSMHAVASLSDGVSLPDLSSEYSDSLTRLRRNQPRTRKLVRRYRRREQAMELLKKLGVLDHARRLFRGLQRIAKRDAA